MFSYLTKTVKKVYKASKKAMFTDKEQYKQTVQYKRIRVLQKYHSQILPTNKLNELASMTYNSDSFYLILDILELKVDIRKVEITNTKKLKRLRNIIIICSYLIKHGAGGFVDEFRQRIEIFERLCYENSYIIDESSTSDQSKLKQYITENVNRGKYLVDLLTDKNKLLREKQISMLIKQKVKLGQKEKQNFNSNISRGIEEEDMSKFEGFLQNYLWKYVNIVDQKLDSLAEVLVDKFQKYLIEDIPESFEIQQLEIKETEKINTQTDFVFKKINEEKQFLEKKQNIHNSKLKQDLLDL